MAKKKKVASKNDAHTELKSLESKWLKDHRMDDLEPIQVKVQAAKVAALVEYIESADMAVDMQSWPLAGAEELVKVDENTFKQGLTNLQKVGVLNSSYKLKGEEKREVEIIDVTKFDPDEDGPLMYRCMKPGGVMITDRDQYICEDEEVVLTEEIIGGSANLQNAIANEWLVRVAVRQTAE